MSSASHVGQRRNDPGSQDLELEQRTCSWSFRERKPERNAKHTALNIKVNPLAAAIVRERRGERPVTSMKRSSPSSSAAVDGGVATVPVEASSGQASGAYAREGGDRIYSLEASIATVPNRVMWDRSLKIEGTNMRNFAQSSSCLISSPIIPPTFVPSPASSTTSSSSPSPPSTSPTLLQRR